MSGTVGKGFYFGRTFAKAPIRICASLRWRQEIGSCMKFKKEICSTKKMRGKCFFVVAVDEKKMKPII